MFKFLGENGIPNYKSSTHSLQSWEFLAKTERNGFGELIRQKENKPKIIADLCQAVKSNNKVYK